MSTQRLHTLEAEGIHLTSIARSAPLRQGEYGKLVRIARLVADARREPQPRVRREWEEAVARAA